MLITRSCQLQITCSSHWYILEFKLNFWLLVCLFSVILLWSTLIYRFVFNQKMKFIVLRSTQLLFHIHLIIINVVLIKLHKSTEQFRDLVDGPSVLRLNIIQLVGQRKHNDAIYNARLRFKNSTRKCWSAACSADRGRHLWAGNNFQTYCWKKPNSSCRCNLG